MATPVKYLHSELPNAPVLSGSAGSLIAVLDACLVNGWGLLTATGVTVAGGVATAAFATTHSFEPDSVLLVAGAAASAVNGEQRASSTTSVSVSWPVTGIADGPVSGTITVKLAPAGWQKLYTGTNKAAYRSLNMSSTRCVLRVDDSGVGSAKYARVRGFESMSDVDTGIGPTPSEAQVSGGCYVTKSSGADGTSRRWMLVASDKSVLLLVAYQSSYASDYSPHFFGDFSSLKSGDAYNFLVCSDPSDQSTQPYVGNATSLVGANASNAAWVVRNYAQSGGSLNVTLRKPGLLADSGAPNSHPIGPNPVDNSLEICPTLVFDGSVGAAPRRGLLPGIYGIPHALGTSYDSKQTISVAVGLPGRRLVCARYYTASATNGYRYAVDITGPWE